MEHFIFRMIQKNELDQAYQIEQECFPPNEACTKDHMKKRIDAAQNCFLVAVNSKTNRIAGYINGIAVDGEHLKDAYFTDAALHDAKGRNLMILSVAVSPQYQKKGLAHQLMNAYVLKAKQDGRKKLVLTCLADKVGMYAHFGFTDLGIADSSWGDEQWHEMIRIL